jgi:hypothetical protein
LVAEVETLRKQVIALELECNRLQSDGRRFEEDERLRECEDVFDQIIGRERQDNESTTLHRFHPMGTCKDPACMAYARRLRGGFKVAITEAYVRERVVRVNGLVRQFFEPLETLREHKDAEIRALRERILRFEQSLRMTSEEADGVQLRSVSLALLNKAAELDSLKLECAAFEREFSKRRGLIVRLMAEEESLKEDAKTLRLEMQGLAEERQLTIGVINDFRAEQSKLQQMRVDATTTQAGQQSVRVRRHQQQSTALEVEVGNLRIERNAALTADPDDGPGGPVDSAPPSADTSVLTFAAAISGGKRPRTGPSHSIVPGPNGTPLILCQCRRYLPLDAMEAHARLAHRVQDGSSRQAFVCPSGCGYLVVGLREECLNGHSASGECARRRGEIARLSAAGRSGRV